jgi:hypothetical protein
MRLHSATRLLVSYLFGVVAGNIVLLPWVRELAIPFIVGGTILAVPLFLFALLVLLLFCNHVQRHLFIWCVLAPFAVVSGWLLVDYIGYFGVRFSLREHLSLRNVWERALLAFVCASASSVLFYVWNRKSPLVGA